MKLITPPWFTGRFKAGERQWQSYALQSGRLPPAQAQLLLSEWILTFYGTLDFCFCFSKLGSHRSKTKLELSMWPKMALNFSSSCVQPPSAAYSMVFLGEFFSPSDMGEDKTHRIYNYHPRNNAKWWLPSKQCSLQLTSKAMQWARTQTVSD